MLLLCTLQTPSYSDIFALSGLGLLMKSRGKNLFVYVYLQIYHFWCSLFFCVNPNFHLMSFPFCLKTILYYFLLCWPAGHEFTGLGFISKCLYFNPIFCLLLKMGLFAHLLTHWFQLCLEEIIVMVPWLNPLSNGILTGYRILVWQVFFFLMSAL